LSAAPPPSRLLALDVFRGATIAAMLLVNNPGSWSSIYSPLRHAEWHGWTPTDLIFPFFLFIVGITTALSLQARRQHGASDSELALQIVRRGLIIILLGLLLSGFPFFTWGSVPGNPDPTFLERVVDRMGRWRFPGVLQRIGICYLVAALIWLKTTTRAQIAVATALLLGYWGAMTLIPVPGSGAIGRATLDDPSGNLAAWIDRQVFGPHLWVQSKTWDPEGLLSTLPAIAIVFLGIFAGKLLRSELPLGRKVTLLALWGAGGAAAGAAWSLLFPINKNLWTSSYTLFTAGLAAICIAACLWIIDIRGWKRWTTPLVVYGVNPILAFVGSGLMARLIYSLIRVDYGGERVPVQAVVYREMFASWLPPEPASLAFALSFVLLWMAILWPLWKRGIYLRV
jgi:predicted acyltransferase